MTAYEKVDVQPDTPEWIQERQKTIGASEVAAVMGLSSYGTTPLMIYKSKLGLPHEFPPQLAYIGHASEAIIAGWVELFAADEYPEFAADITLGGALQPGFMARSKKAPWLHATFDRVTGRGNDILPWQFKTAHHFAGHHWDEGVPLDVQAQEQAEMYVAGSEHAYVVVWIGGRDFKVFRLDRDEDFINKNLLPKTQAFYHYMLDKVAPPPVTKAEVAELFPSQHAEIEGLPLVFDWVEQRDVLLADKKRIEEELAPIELGIGKYMGVNDTLTRDGFPILTYKSQSGRRSVDSKKLAADHPDVYAEVQKFGDPFKVFRRVKPKGLS